jgi:hypothetical protein
MGTLITKYQITEKDIYTISFLENHKKNVGFMEGEKLKGKILGVLKPYKVSFIDLANLIKEIAATNLHLYEEIKAHYGDIELDKVEYNSGIKYALPIGAVIGVIVIVFMFGFMNNASDDAESSTAPLETNNSSPADNQNSEPTTLKEPSNAEKKVMCLRMFGGGDMSAWENAQAECLGNNSESACECMQILAQ